MSRGTVRFECDAAGCTRTYSRLGPQHARLGMLEEAADTAEARTLAEELGWTFERSPDGRSVHVFCPPHARADARARREEAVRA